MVAYLMESPHSRDLLTKMIIPQMEAEAHGVDVVGMMFFFDNVYMLQEGSEIADRLAAIAEKTGMLLMACDQCCYERNVDGKLKAPALMGCFPNVYKALGGVGVDQVITL